MTKILYTIAKNKDGELIKAIDADKGNNYFCPLCNNELLLRKSGNTGKNSKRPHFAHKTLTPNCTPETALHFLAKNSIAEKLQKSINENTPINFSWRCIFCGEMHKGDLLKKTRKVKIEHDLKLCRPDISLFDNNDRVFAVIEVVVTHKPDASTIKYFRENNIVLIQINFNSDSELNEIDNKIAKPDRVLICYNPKCKSCGHYQRKSAMTIIDGHCWRCPSEMKIAILSENCSHSGPDSFSESEIKLAKDNGVIIKKHFSKTRGESYLANTCPSCGSFSGDHFLFTDFYVPATMHNTMPYKTFDVGFHCDYCSSPDYEGKDERYEKPYH
ncbi:MAG TPA: competence protein CoiA family protein [Bacteroidia bacterium]|nr:competence protein CoiA family protein [Bacteroidia bacterium]